MITMWVNSYKEPTGFLAHLNILSRWLNYFNKQDIVDEKVITLEFEIESGIFGATRLSFNFDKERANEVLKRLKEVINETH